MLQMYKGAINSPETIITNNISNTDTLIYVQDETKVPTDLPNLMVLGTGISAETIKVLSISGLAITVERAFQGTAKTWNAGTTIARNFTEYDYEALKNNVEELADNQGDLATLTTTDKTNLVEAVNELVSQSAQIDTEMNSHLTSTVSRAMLLSRDLSLTGVQTTGALPFLPKALIVDVVVSGTKKISIGKVGANGQYSIYLLPDNGNWYPASSEAIAISDSLGNVTFGTITINSNKTLSISWAKIGTGATGTAEIRILAIGHGE